MQPQHRKTDPNKLTLYIPDTELFNSLRADVRNLWYKNYGVFPNKGDIMLLVFEYTKTGLEDTLAQVHKVSKTIKTIYARVSN